MDGVSIAANIVGIATAGVALSIKLVTLGTQISTASERVSSIGNDISLTSGILHQLGELMTQKTTENGISVFSQGGLETTRNSAAMCERIFGEVEIELSRASEQIRGCKRLSGGKVKLSRTEKAKWPFLQPSIDLLRADLREAKGTLMLMLQVASLALSKRMADLNQSAPSNSEQRDFMRAIVALHQQQQAGNEKLVGKLSAQSENSTSFYSTTMADASSIDNLSSGADKSSTLLYFQPSALPERTKARRSIVKPVGKSEDHPAQTSDTSSHHMTSTSGSLSRDFSPNTSLAVCSTSNPSIFSENSRIAWSGGPKAYPQPSRNAGESIDKLGPNRELSKELSLFLVKPIVRDFFDKVELSWSVQDTKLKEPAIDKYLQKNEEDGVPSVLDMLEKLHDHEQAMVDAELSKTSFGSEGALLSLKRTMTDMRHRDMTFRDVPGLQFVIERQVPPAEPRVVENAVRSHMIGAMQRVPVGPRSHESQRESWVEGLFAGLEDCVVVRGGMVEDRQGDTVGVVVDGDLKRLVGCAVSEHGVIIDRYGTVKGHAEPLEAPEEVTDPSSLYGNRKGEFWNDTGEGIEEAELLPAGSTQAVEGRFARWKTQPQNMADVAFSEEKPRPDWADDESDMVGESAELQMDLGTEENPLARNQVNEMEARLPLLRSSSAQFMDLDTVSSAVQPYGELPAASQTADEKRKRNATAADRFRQRRREKERETSDRISKLEQQLREKEELLRRESVQSTGVYNESLSAEVNSESDDDEDREADQGVEDAVVAALLQRYTTVLT